MRIVCVTVSLTGLFLAGCAEPPPPVTVAEFMENPRLLEATMVSCGQNRSEMKYEAECVNAREAVNRLERAAERERRLQLEAQSDRKRQALRRTQEAAAAARRRAEEERRRLEQAEYLGVFEDGSAVTQAAPAAAPTPAAANAPAAAIEPPPPEPETLSEEVPLQDTPPPEASDLEAVREELRRRQQQEAEHGA